MNGETSLDHPFLKRLSSNKYGAVGKRHYASLKLSTKSFVLQIE